jgi:hypothetical protein
VWLFGIAESLSYDIRTILHFADVEQPDDSFNRLSSVVAATEARMPFPAYMPAIASSRQPVPCSDSNRNSNDITNMTSVENTVLVDGSMIEEREMSLGG